MYQVRGANVGDIRSRISLRPMETQGCWYNDHFLISSNLQYLTHNVCSNKLVINKVNFTAESSFNLVNERDLYKMYNCAGSYIRDINVISIPRSCKYQFHNGLESANYDEMLASYLNLVENHCLNLVTVPPHDNIPQLPPELDNRTIHNSWAGEYIVDYDENTLVTSSDRDDGAGPIEFTAEYHEDRINDFFVKNEEDWLWENEEVGYSDDEDVQWEYFTADKKHKRTEVIYDKKSGKEVINEEDKLLIFTTGRKAWIPHQIGIKKMSKVPFKQTMTIPTDIASWEKQNRIEMMQEKLDIATIPWQDYEVYLYKIIMKHFASVHLQIVKFSTVLF